MRLTPRAQNRPEDSGRSADRKERVLAKPEASNRVLLHGRGEIGGWALPALAQARSFLMQACSGCSPLIQRSYIR